MTIDNYKLGQTYRPDLIAAQWYFGSRSHDFRLYGTGYLIEALTPYLDLITLEIVPEGTLIKQGKPAVTITIYGNENINIGGEIEVIVYQSLWYMSTVGTLLHSKRELLAKFGFNEYVIPKIKRGCATPEQAKRAEEVFGRVFYPLNNEPVYGVADHSYILLNGEDYAFSNNASVMIDTHCEKAAISKLSPDHSVMVDSGNIVEKVKHLYDTTKNHIIQLETCSSEQWDLMVETLASYIHDKERVMFSIGSEVFQNVSRDTFDLVYKACARDLGDGWLGVSKECGSKSTLKGFLSPW